MRENGMTSGALAGDADLGIMLFLPAGFGVSYSEVDTGSGHVLDTARP